MGYPRHQRARAFKFAGSGNVTVNGTSYADLNTGIDFVLAARADDYIEVGMCGRFAPEATTGYIDVVTLVAGSPVNYLSGNGAGGQGIAGWRGQSGTDVNLAGGTIYKLVEADIVSGLVTLRLRAKTSSATNKLFVGNGAYWWAKNLGPAET